MMADAKARSVNLVVLCAQQDMGEEFVREACGAESGGAGTAVFGDRVIHMSVLGGEPRLNPGWDEAVAKADLLAIVARFLDVISLDKIKAIYRRLPSERVVPLSVVVFREDGEVDFKISCPTCGQKLWVRDFDIGKRGRCPNCKRPFRLPAQDEHLRSQLLPADIVPIVTVDRSDPKSLRNALNKVLERLTADLIPAEETFDPNVLKQSTVRIQVSTGDTTAGNSSSAGKTAGPV